MHSHASFYHGMNGNFHIVLALTIVLSTLGWTAPASAAPQPERINPDLPSPALASLLAPDGTLDLSSGFSGDLDARGYRLVSGQNEPPRFVAQAAGDERWEAGTGVNGVNGYVLAIAIDNNGNVYVGGYFNLVGNLPVNNIARWDGIQWSTLGYGLDNQVLTLAWDGAHHWLYAGGYFSGICMDATCSVRDGSRGVARWDASGGGSWHALGYGVHGYVEALAIDDNGDLYAGGYFPEICVSQECSTGLVVEGIAKWNPSGTGYADWSALSSGGSSGVAGVVSALAWWNAPQPLGRVLIVGGSLGSAGNQIVNNLAFWIPPGSILSGWRSFQNGVDSLVYTLAIDPSTNSVYVGGTFKNICNDIQCASKTEVDYIAVQKVSSTMSWGGLEPGGLTNGTFGYVRSLSIDSAHKVLYAGGFFSSICPNASCTNPTSISTNIARWDFSSATPSWSALGAGMDSNGRVNAIVWNPVANILFAGGGFASAGGRMTTGVATWDGNTWSPTGSGDGVIPTVNSVVMDKNGRIYAGGTFLAIGDRFVNRIAVWNVKTKAWSPLGNGLDGDVNALLVDSSGNLYAGGWFLNTCNDQACTTGSLRVNHIAKWTWSPGGDNGTWSTVGKGIYGYVYALALDHNNHLYAGGLFEGSCLDEDCRTAHSPATNIAVWNDNQWIPLGMGLNYSVKALAVSQDNSVYVGGVFSNYCGNPDCSSYGPRVNHIAKWSPNGSGGAWSALGNGLDNEVYSLVIDQKNTLYVGGKFQSICDGIGCAGNNQVVNGIASWDGSAWSPVGFGFRDQQGTPGVVNAMGIDRQSRLIAAGAFQSLCGDVGCTSSGATVNNIARWDRTSGWLPLGSGIGPTQNSSINCVEYAQDTLAVGGDFATAGNKVSANFAVYQDPRVVYLPFTIH